MRAAVKNLSSEKTVQGGSTMTMQLVRNLYTRESATVPAQDPRGQARRGARERAQQGVDPHKYLNTVPYGTVGGQTALGIQAAARIFFDKPASELKLHEAALLAGLPQAPSTYNPFPRRRRPRRAATRCCARWPTSG